MCTYIHSNAPDLVEGLHDVSCYPLLFAELTKRGYTQYDARGCGIYACGWCLLPTLRVLVLSGGCVLGRTEQAQIAGGNVLRALRRAESVARELQQQRQPLPPH